MHRKDLSTIAKAKIWIRSSENLARILEGSLIPEVKRPSSERSTVSVVAGKNGLEIHIRSSDVSALRAASNSYLRWVAAILDVVNTVQ